MKTINVYGIDFQVWSDTKLRATRATNTKTNETKTIHGSGYITKESTIKQAIIYTFHVEAPKKRVLTQEQKAKKAARAKARREAKKAFQAKVTEGLNPAI